MYHVKNWGHVPPIPLVPPPMRPNVREIGIDWTTKGCVNTQTEHKKSDFRDAELTAA